MATSAVRNGVRDAVKSFTGRGNDNVDKAIDDEKAGRRNELLKHGPAGCRVSA